MNKNTKIILLSEVVRDNLLLEAEEALKTRDPQRANVLREAAQRITDERMLARQTGELRAAVLAALTSEGSAVLATLGGAL